MEEFVSSHLPCTSTSGLMPNNVSHYRHWSEVRMQWKVQNNQVLLLIKEQLLEELSICGRKWTGFQVRILKESSLSKEPSQVSCPWCNICSRISGTSLKQMLILFVKQCSFVAKSTPSWLENSMDTNISASFRILVEVRESSPKNTFSSLRLWSDALQWRVLKRKHVFVNN